MNRPACSDRTSFRYESLDHWRGSAALAVVFLHACYPLREAETNSVIHGLVRLSTLGSFGVNMFFVISGYCVAVKAAKTVVEEKAVTPFLSDRLLRIFPAYWAACIAAIGIAVVSSPFSSGRLRDSMPDGWLGLLSDAFLIHPYTGHNKVLGVSWTLVYEVGFYVLIALGILLALRRGNWLSPLIVGGLAAVAGVAGAGSWKPFYVLNYWPEFYCGIAVFLFVKYQHAESLKAYGAALIPMALASIAIGFRGFESAGSMPGAAVFSLFLMALKQHDHKLTSFRLIKFPGKCGVFSYSLYLIHQPITTRLVNGGLRITGTTGFGAILPVVAAFGCAVFAGAAFYRVCEAPLEQIRQRHSRRVRSEHDAHRVASELNRVPLAESLHKAESEATSTGANHHESSFGQSAAIDGVN